jgi:hypothetical protein
MMTDRRSLLSSVVVSMVALRSGSVRLLGSSGSDGGIVDATWHRGTQG